MAKGTSSEFDLSTLKFWFLFMVGLVVVLSLYKGFTNSAAPRPQSDPKTTAKVKGRIENRAGKKEKGL